MGSSQSNPSVSPKSDNRPQCLLESYENNGLEMWREAWGGFSITNDGVTVQFSEEQARWVARMLTGALPAQAHRVAA